MPVKLFFKVIKALNFNATPKQIGLGFAFGAFLGLIPGFNLCHILILFSAYLFNVNIAFFFVGAIVYKLFLPVFINITEPIGYFLLVDLAILRPLWTFLYNLPIFPWTKFYNTAVLGGIVLAKILFIFNVIIATKFIVFYRNKLQKKIMAIPFIKVLKHTSLVKWFLRVKGTL